jgi:dienelactone hydrolase
MNRSLFIMTLAFGLTACSGQNGSEQTTAHPNEPFAVQHKQFHTHIVRSESEEGPVPTPPKDSGFTRVTYPSQGKTLPAYISADPGDGKKHPAIIWVVGGWSNSIDLDNLAHGEWDNDQSALAFADHGIVTMYPTFRGGSNGTGAKEAKYGEMDDVIAAYDYLASQPYVDTQRIYLGGHSTGGTLVMLTAEALDKFRAVFAFGSTDRFEKHNATQFVFDTNDKREFDLRSPILWLNEIKNPTFVFEGEESDKAASLDAMKSASKNSEVHFYLVNHADHFSTLAPLTEMLAKKVVEDTGPQSNIQITDADVQAAMAQPPIQR